MFLLLYGFARARHHILQCVILILLSMAMLLFLCVFHAGRKDLERQLNDAYEKLLIECVLCNLTGTKTDNLDIKDYAVSLFFREQYSYRGQLTENPCLDYVKEVRAKCRLRYKCLLNGESAETVSMTGAASLIGLTDTGMEPVLKAENGGNIVYLENNTEELFHREEALCIVSQELYEKLDKEEGEPVVLRLAVRDAQGGSVAEQSLRVAGVYAGAGEEIYCPWAVSQQLSEKVTGGMQAEALCFTVRDNRKLDELKEFLTGYFTQVDVTGRLQSFPEEGVLSYYEYAVMIYDEHFFNTIAQLESNNRIMDYIRPILYGIVAGLGFFISFLFIRNRKREFAILRAMGTSKKAVLLELFCEQLLLCLLGVFCALLCFWVWQGANKALFSLTGIYVTAYLLGALFAAVLFVRADVKAALMEKE